MSTPRARQRTDRQYKGENDRYTPAWLLMMVERMLGPDYRDPCPASFGQVPAVNGLAIPWHGRVFCNPPYRPIAPWIAKAVTEPVDELILLVPAYTDTRWFAPLWQYPMCFIHGRVYFRKPSGVEVRAPHPSVLVYRGQRVARFAQEFGRVGTITRPYRAYQADAPSLWSESA